jgi:hypothetical protein
LQNGQGGAVVGGEHGLGVQVSPLGQVPAEQLFARRPAALGDEGVGPGHVAADLPFRQGLAAVLDLPGVFAGFLLFGHKMTHVPGLGAVEPDGQHFVNARLNKGPVRLGLPGHFGSLSQRRLWFLSLHGGSLAPRSRPRASRASPDR